MRLQTGIPSKVQEARRKIRDAHIGLALVGKALATIVSRNGSSLEPRVEDFISPILSPPCIPGK